MRRSVQERRGKLLVVADTKPYNALSGSPPIQIGPEPVKSKARRAAVALSFVAVTLRFGASSSLDKAATMIQ